MIARRHARHATADLDHHPGALVPEDGGEQPLGILAREGEGIGMANAGGLDLDQHLAGPWAVEIYGLDAERLACAGRQRRTNLHRSLLVGSNSCESISH